MRITLNMQVNSKMEHENNNEISKLKRAVQDVNLVAEQTRTQSADEQAVSL